MSKEYNSALQARVEQFLKEKNISQAKAAPLMGISQTALSQYRRSMYDNGDIAALESKLEEFFRTQEEQEVNTAGLWHTAFDDANNTGKLLIEMFNRGWKLEDFFAAREVYEAERAARQAERAKHHNGYRRW